MPKYAIAPILIRFKRCANFSQGIDRAISMFFLTVHFSSCLKQDKIYAKIYCNIDTHRASIKLSRLCYSTFLRKGFEKSQ